MNWNWSEMKTTVSQKNARMDGLKGTLCHLRREESSQEIMCGLPGNKYPYVVIQNDYFVWKEVWTLKTIHSSCKLICYCVKSYTTY